jgi:capsular polysaccharide biosynthesis protein
MNLKNNNYLNMSKKTNQPKYNEDEIDFYQIIKILFDSKKIIILSTLFFFLASIIYTSLEKPQFKTSAIIEIGYYEMNNGEIELIEKPLDLINDLNINLTLLNEQISIQPLFEKLILLETISSFENTNKTLLNNITSYVIDRHSKLEKTAIYSSGDDTLFDESNYLGSAYSEYIQRVRNEHEEEILILKNDIKFIERGITELNELLIEETSNLKLINSDPVSRLQHALQTPSYPEKIYSYKKQITNLEKQKTINQMKINSLNIKLRDFKILERVSTKVRNNFKTTIINPKNKLTISLGIIIGFFIGIFLVFIRRFFKSFKEIEKTI